MNPLQKKKAMHESIVVMVLNLLNVEELLFEDNSDMLLEQYIEVLRECSHILYQEEGCRDVIIYNTCVCGIFEGYSKESVDNVQNLARQVNGLLKQCNNRRENKELGKLVYGIGIASGEAIAFALDDASWENNKNIWMGPVFCRAQAMSRMAGIDGIRRVIVADTY